MTDKTQTIPPRGDLIVAYKYADPTEDARYITDRSEAEEIARTDPSLIVWLDDDRIGVSVGDGVAILSYPGGEVGVEYEGGIVTSVYLAEGGTRVTPPEASGIVGKIAAEGVPAAYAIAVAAADYLVEHREHEEDDEEDDEQECGVDDQTPHGPWAA